MQSGVQFLRVGVALFTNWKHSNLLWAEPQRKRAGEVLNQHARESFQTSKWRAMNHHWSVRLVVGALVRQIKSNRQVVIHLHGAKLPRATDDIAHNKINLGSVERGLAWLLAKWNAKRLRGVAARLFGLVPIFRKADIFVGLRTAQANAHAVVLHSKCAKNKFDKFQTALQFVSDLILAAE